MKKIITLIISYTLTIFTTYSQSALNFDGIDDYVNFGISPQTHLIDSFTVEAKIKQNSNQNWPAYVNNFEATSSNLWKGYWLGGDPNGYAVWYVGDTSATTSGYWLYSTTIITDNNWHTISGTVAGDTAKLYIDGILESSLYIPNAVLNSNDSLRVGNDVLNETYTGLIDDIRIWNTVRTASEIMLYKDSCLIGTENNLSAFYHFENGVGTSIITDLTGNGTNGVLKNADTTTIWSTGVNCTVCDFSINIPSGIDTRTECNSYTWIDGNNYTASNNTATYNIVGGATNGCDSLVTLDLTINSVSDLTTSISGVTISANNTGASYQWLDCDNNYSVINAETGQSFTATVNGNYALELTENGCIDTTTCVAITTVGFEENSFGNKLIVYPNPTNGNFSIDLGAIFENSQITITDIAGKLIESKTISPSQIINLSIEEPNGIYIVSIQAGDKKAVIRLVKE